MNPRIERPAARTPGATIAIVARNARQTIQRAVASALAQGNYTILLVDDYSADGTADCARELAGDRLQVIRLHEHRTLGMARQTALREITTPYAVWLDADDELLPGRVQRLVSDLHSQNRDLASDCVELFDGISGDFRMVLSIPSFIKGSGQSARLFERNYLPGIGVLAFRTEFARRVAYDAALHGGEDIDFALRSVLEGARFSMLSHVGYRQYAYPKSLSRQIDSQKKMYRRALLKHHYEVVRSLYGKAGIDSRITAWGLLSMAVFREDYHQAMKFLLEAEALIKDPAEILEPSGPQPVPECWRVLFHKGTVLLLMGRAREATPHLEAAESILSTAEGSNNLGVARRKTGDASEARRLFELCLSRHPGFLDALINVTDHESSRITSHPCRFHPSRDDYSPGAA